MKKLSYLIVLTLILGLVLTGCSLLSNIGQAPATEQSGITYLTKNETGPVTIDLIAGQSINVGTVTVSNDSENLYIKYETTGDWYMTETHLHVACSEPEIPQNKKGNPTPGKFMHNEDHAYVQEYVLDPIPLEGFSCADLCIAAHAVVCKLSDVVTVTLASGTQTLSAGYTETTKPLNPLVPTSYSGSGTWSPAVPVSDPPIPPWIVLPGAVWVSSAATTEGGFGDQWRLFKEDFTIPSGAVNIAGLLYMTADNAVEAYLNGFSVGSTTYVFGSKPDPIVNPTHHYFQSPWGPFNLALQADSNNTLAFVVRNWGHSDYNPTGLIYNLDYEYQLLLECESAWGAGDRFVDKGNWGMYFEYVTVEPYSFTDTQPVSDGTVGDLVTTVAEDGDWMVWTFDFPVEVFTGNGNLNVGLIIATDGEGNGPAFQIHNNDGADSGFAVGTWLYSEWGPTISDGWMGWHSGTGGNNELVSGIAWIEAIGQRNTPWEGLVSGDGVMEIRIKKSELGNTFHWAASPKVGSGFWAPAYDVTMQIPTDFSWSTPLVDMGIPNYIAR